MQHLGGGTVKIKDGVFMATFSKGAYSETSDYEFEEYRFPDLISANRFVRQNLATTSEQRKNNYEANKK